MNDYMPNLLSLTTLSQQILQLPNPNREMENIHLQRNGKKIGVRCDFKTTFRDLTNLRTNRPVKN